MKPAHTILVIPDHIYRVPAYYRKDKTPAVARVVPVRIPLRALEPEPTALRQSLYAALIMAAFLTACFI